MCEVKDPSSGRGGRTQTVDKRCWQGATRFKSEMFSGTPKPDSGPFTSAPQEVAGAEQKSGCGEILDLSPK